MSPIASQRRLFLELMARTAVGIPFLALTGTACAEETPPADSLASTSSRGSKLGHWADHSHVLYVPRQLFRDPPPQGATLSTTVKFLHSHEVTLTRAELITVARGGRVQVEASGGAHTFSIALG